MIEPLPAPDEQGRLVALRGLGVLDTPPEERFDRVTRLAARLFAVPIVLVSLVDANRQWFKSRHGLDVSETPRRVSFCGHAILSGLPLVIPDTLADPRFADNPLVTGGPRIRFYAGQPLRSLDGHRVGTLCVIDRKPCQFDDGDVQALAELALVPVLFLTERQSAEDRVLGFRLGADDYIAKDVLLEEIVARVRKALRHRETLDQIFATTPPAAERPALCGSLHEIGLASLLSILDAERKTGTLVVDGGDAGVAGKLWLRQGKVVAAEANPGQRLRGREAVFQLFTAGDGRFEFHVATGDRPEEAPDEIRMSTPALLMEIAVRVDESRVG